MRDAMLRGSDGLQPVLSAGRSSRPIVDQPVGQKSDADTTFQDILILISKANSRRDENAQDRSGGKASCTTSMTSENTLAPQNSVFSSSSTKETNSGKLSQNARPIVCHSEGSAHWSSWPKTSEPFTAIKDMTFLRHRHLNAWEECRIITPNRTWPTGPCGAAGDEFHDRKREGQPAWQAVSWRRAGQRCFGEPPPVRNRVRSARGQRKGQLPQSPARRPASATSFGATR
eukprot:TRINITY_DN14450_c0_g2_i1.p1 TRINITY_DN14450_c0_g2~~TRINITY_DN14450_c0_g2_i1.p1  ORF type:complete len:230 (-),score=19.33 TRINITY_DN14450_c0_g2_i1:132-821(-)